MKFSPDQLVELACEKEHAEIGKYPLDDWPMCESLKNAQEDPASVATALEAETGVPASEWLAALDRISDSLTDMYADIDWLNAIEYHGTEPMYRYNDDVNRTRHCAYLAKMVMEDARCK